MNVKLSKRYRIVQFILSVLAIIPLLSLFQTIPVAQADYSLPLWWNNNQCDNGGGHNTGATLNGTYKGIPSCSGGNGYCSSFNGQWNGTGSPCSNADPGIQEWQCIEMVFRYLYAAYGQTVYSLGGSSSNPGGKDIVNYYPANPGQSLQKVTNQAGSGVAPQMGDVLSFDAVPGVNAYGHTAIVQSSNVDGSGNGSITVFQQNAPVTDKFTVANWYVQRHSDGHGGWTTGYGTILGWLHSTGATQSPSPTPTIPPSPNIVTLGHKDIAIQSDGSLVAFKKDNSGIVSTNGQNGNGGAWLGYNQIVMPTSSPIITMTGEPNIITNSTGGLEAFAHGSDNHIYHAYEQTPGNASSWSNWQVMDLTRYFAGNPVAAEQTVAVGQSLNGYLIVFARGSDNGMYFDYQASNGSWQGWNPVNGANTFQGDPSVAQNSSGDLELFARTSDTSYSVYYTNQTSPGSTTSWNNWQQFAPNGIGTDPVAIRQPNGYLDVFGKGVGNDGTMYHDYQDSTGWHGWGPVVGGAYGFNGAPTVVINQTGGLQAFAKGNDNIIYSSWESTPGTNGAWTAWTQLDTINASTTPMQADPIAITLSNGYMAVINKSMDDNMWFEYQDNGNWTGWYPISPVVQVAHKDVGMNINGSMVSFKRDSNNNIDMDYQNSAEGSWQGWTQMVVSPNTIKFNQDPVVIRNKTGALQAFAVGSDTIAYSSQETAPNSNIWTTWGQIAANTLSGNVVAGADPNGYLILFARANQYMYLDYQSVNGWNGWNYVSGTNTLEGDPSVAENASGELELFAKSAWVGHDQDTVYHTNQSSPGDNNTWTNWAQVPGGNNTIGSNPVAVRQPNGNLDVFGSGSGNDGNMYHNFEDTHGNWQGWYPIIQNSNLTHADPSVITNEQGGLQIFAQAGGGDNRIFSSTETTPGVDSGSGWGSWSLLAANSMGGAPIAINQINGLMDVYAPWSVNLYHDYENGSSGSWTGIQLINP